MGSYFCCSKRPVEAQVSLSKMDSENTDNVKAGKTTNEEHVENIFVGTLRRQFMSILLVFVKNGKQCAAFLQAAKLAKYKCGVVKTVDGIVSSYVEQSPNVIIVDMRKSSKFETLCKIFSKMSNKENVVLVAVRESNDDLNYSTTHQLIKAGFTRQFLENFNVNVCLTELQCIEYGELQTRFPFQMVLPFVAAVENSNDSIEISNSRNSILYVNGAFERLFGYEKDEAVGNTFLSMTDCNQNDASVVDAMNSQMKQGIVWKGLLTVCNKSGEIMSHRCNAVPVLGASGHAQNFVVIRREIGPGRGNSVVRKGSTRSSERSRSVTQIEAPMTKVIQTINKIQKTCPPNISEALDNVLEVLRLTELYVPIKAGNLDNEATKELLNGLMTLPSPTQTTTNALTGIVESELPLVSPQSSRMSVAKFDDEINFVLSRESKWHFDIINLETLTNNKPLQYLAFKTFERFGVAKCMKIDRMTLFLWLQMIESHYHESNPYHNSTHAGDVMHASAYFLNLETLKNKFRPDEKVSVLLAAVVHDLNHPGKTNPYLINSDSNLAQLYNDLAVLESHHVSFAFRLTLQDATVNIFKNLSRDEYRNFRQQIIDMVLATEMSKHMQHLSRFMHTIIDHHATELESRPTSAVHIGAIETNAIIKRMLIKCADVSNSARPRHLSITWAKRIAEEYFQQTEDERAKGLPVVMPGFDRRTCNIASSQLSFMNLFINNMFDVWHKFCDIPDLIVQIRSNYQYWKELEKKEATELALSQSANKST